MGCRVCPALTPQNKASLFYQTLHKVCVLINRLEGPLVIGAVAATVQIGTQLALADSPQKRNIIPLPLVRAVRRDGKPVFDWRGNACLELLQNDMGKGEHSKHWNKQWNSLALKTSM